LGTVGGIGVDTPVRRVSQRLGFTEQTDPTKIEQDLMGLIPSNHNATNLSDRPPLSAANAQYSGGAHNFPRLLEDWHNDMGSGTPSGLYIRGSIVALFESRFATEPRNLPSHPAPLPGWPLRRYDLLQRQPDQRRLQEPADWRD